MVATLSTMVSLYEEEVPSLHRYTWDCGLLLDDDDDVCLNIEEKKDFMETVYE
jgi:hypothetical protein